MELLVSSLKQILHTLCHSLNLQIIDRSQLRFHLSKSGGSAFQIIRLSVISTITTLAQTTCLLYLMFHKKPSERGFKKASSLKPHDARFAFEYNTQVIHLWGISTLARRSLVLSISSTVTSWSLPQLCSLCVASTIMNCPSKFSLFYTSYTLCLLVGSHSLNNSYSMAKAIASHCLTLV